MGHTLGVTRPGKQLLGHVHPAGLGSGLSGARGLALPPPRSYSRAPPPAVGSPPQTPGPKLMQALLRVDSA